MPAYSRSFFGGNGGKDPNIDSLPDASKQNAVLKEAMKALHLLELSIEPILDFLQTIGVSIASVRELRRQMIEKEGHVYIMEAAQEYVQCMITNPTPAEAAFITELFMNAWQCVCTYTMILYRDAYKNFHRLRSINMNMLEKEQQGTNPAHVKKNEIAIQRALDRQIQLAEECTAAQKGFIVVRRWQQDNNPQQLLLTQRCSDANQPPLQGMGSLKQQQHSIPQRRGSFGSSSNMAPPRGLASMKAMSFRMPKSSSVK